jgi:hypothetical protein
MHLELLVTDGYRNEALARLLQKNNTDINEYILTVGTSLYERQGDVIREYDLDKDGKAMIEAQKSEICSLKEQEGELRALMEATAENYKRDKQALVERLRKEGEDDQRNLEIIHETRLRKLKEDKLELEKRLETELDKERARTRKDYEEKINDLLKDIRELQKQKDALESERVFHLNNGKEEAKAEIAERMQEMKDEIRDLKQKEALLTQKLFENQNSETVMSKLNTIEQCLNPSDNQSKGDKGERDLEMYLTHYFPGCQIIDTHRNTSCGDLHFHYMSLRILFESKNKIELKKKDDIDKFYFDIDAQVAKGTINAAILVSHKETSLVDGHRQFYFEIYRGIPVIFIAGAASNENLIRNSVLMMLYLIKNGITNKIENDDEKLKFVVEALHSSHDTLEGQMEDNVKQKKLLDQLVVLNQQQLQGLKDIYAVLDSVFQRFPEFCREVEEVVDAEFMKIVDVLVRHKKAKPSFKISMDGILAMEEMKDVGINL